MRIAVIIPAYNEAGNIGTLVEETIAAVPETVLQEVIVIDDASDDGTDAEENTERYLRLKVFVLVFDNDCYSDNGTGERSDKDREESESPSQQRPIAQHHFYVAEAHRLDTARAFPDFTDQPK